MKHKTRTDEQVIQEILSAHADALAAGRPLTPTGSCEPESLRSLLAVAELVHGTLVPVQPNPRFVRSLGKSLLASMRQGRQVLTLRTRRAALIGAAVLGSLASAVSVIGVIVYVMRHRVRVG